MKSIDLSSLPNYLDIGYFKTSNPQKSFKIISTNCCLKPGVKFEIMRRPRGFTFDNSKTMPRDFINMLVFSFSFSL